MRRGRLIFGMTALIACASLVAAASSDSAQEGSPTPAVAKPTAVGVDALMRNPEKYQGTIVVRGVVGAVFPKEQRLGLLDAVYLNCCSTPCDSIQLLPVRWTGTMPGTKSLVRVTGEIRRTGGKLELAAVGIEPAEAAPQAAK